MSATPSLAVTKEEKVDSAIGSRVKYRLPTPIIRNSVRKSEGECLRERMVRIFV